MWTAIMTTHYARHWSDKIVFLMLVMAMADHPKWTWKTARTWYRNLRMVHTSTTRQ
jgi:hypothetical protein